MYQEYMSIWGKSSNTYHNSDLKASQIRNALQCDANLHHKTSVYELRPVSQYRSACIANKVCIAIKVRHTFQFVPQSKCVPPSSYWNLGLYCTAAQSKGVPPNLYWKPVCNALREHIVFRILGEGQVCTTIEIWYIVSICIAIQNDQNLHCKPVVHGNSCLYHDSCLCHFSDLYHKKGLRCISVFAPQFGFISSERCVSNSDHISRSSKSRSVYSCPGMCHRLGASRFVFIQVKVCA